MVFEHRMPGNRGRAADPAQEAAIARALAGGKISQEDAGILLAAAMYGSPEVSAKADAALRRGKRAQR